MRFQLPQASCAYDLNWGVFLGFAPLRVASSVHAIVAHNPGYKQGPGVSPPSSGLTPAVSPINLAANGQGFARYGT